MAHRKLIPSLFVLLSASACGSDDRPSSDAATPVDGAVDARDVGLTEAGEDGRIDSPDVTSPDADARHEGGLDARPDSDGGGDRDVRNDVDVVPDGDDRQPDSDANPVDGDANPVDGDAPPLGCAWTDERLSFAVAYPNGDIHDCAHTVTDGGLTRQFHALLSGVVRANAPDAGSSTSVTIDTCTADVCPAEATRIEVSTPTPFTVPVGAFVEAEYWIEMSHECMQFLRISNLPAWKGQQNPVSQLSKTYAVVSDGNFDPQSKMGPTGITVSVSRLGCPAADASCGPRTPDSYQWEFSASGSTPLSALMGQTAPWQVGGQNVIVRNHRSYASGLCDADWDWAFSIVGQ